MRSIVAALFVVGTACDLNEGESEEAREAEEVTEAGRGPDGMGTEVGADRTPATGDGIAAVDDREHSRVDLDRQIDEAEAWLAEARREIEAGTRTANNETKAALDQVERDLKDARDGLAKLADQAAADWQKTRDEIRHELNQAETTIGRLDAAGSP